MVPEFIYFAWYSFLISGHLGKPYPIAKSKNLSFLFFFNVDNLLLIFSQKRSFSKVNLLTQSSKTCQRLFIHVRKKTKTKAKKDDSKSLEHPIVSIILDRACRMA
jgi:hypothetical protein